MCPIKAWRDSVSLRSTYVNSGGGSEIKADQLTGHISQTLQFLLKAEQKCHGTTQGPDLDFNRWWAVALKSQADLFFLLASLFIPFQHRLHYTLIPLKRGAFRAAAAANWRVSSFKNMNSRLMFRFAETVLGIRYLLTWTELMRTAWVALPWWLPFFMINSSMVWISLCNVLPTFLHQNTAPFNWSISCSSRYRLI